MAEELTKLRFTRGQQRATLTRIQKYIETLQSRDLDTKTIFEIKARLEKLIFSNQKFDEIQTKVEMLVEGDEGKLQEEEQKRVEFEEAYYKLYAEMQELISMAEGSEAQAPRTENVSNSQNTRLNLPTIDLPTFDGQYHNWISFRDSFKSLIHDKEKLTKIEKFHYLKSGLKGEAASLLDSLDISENNYQLALDTLADRFENRKLLIYNHIRIIMEIPTIQRDVLLNLRKLVDDLKRNLSILGKLGLDTSSWDPLLLYIITDKVDEATRREWEAKTCSTDTPTLQEFYMFVSNRCQYLEQIKNKKQAVTQKFGSKLPTKPTINKLPMVKSTQQAFVTTQEKNSCPHCSSQHPLFGCPKFLEMPIMTRQQVVKQLRICFNCLKPHHIVKDCIAGGCKKCGSKHNTLLHSEPLENSSKNDVPSVLSAATSSHGSNNTEVLLSTAVVYVIDNKGVKHSARALLDSGSQSNFLSREFFDKLKVPSQKINQPVKGLNQISMNIQDIVELEIKSPVNRYQTKTSFLVISKITDNLPQTSFDIISFKIPDNIVLADPKFAMSGKVDMLIGAPLFWELLCVGQIKINNTKLIMQKTRLGWVISGSIPFNRKAQPNSLSCNFISLEDRIEKFWAVEEISTPSLSKEEQEFEKQFQQALKRREDGRFEVGLPLNSNVGQLGNSFDNAKRRFLLLEKRLSKSPTMKQKYQEFIDEYEKLGHMTRVAENQSEPKLVYYLPHHGVFKEGSVTTKLRVVFDGSAKTDTGISLNDTLISGSQLQSDLFSILLRFRKHSIVITSDIEKMYRQIYITPKDRDLQRILWRSNPSEPISLYRLNTVTYGTKSGSFLAIRCLNEVARRIQNDSPEISRIINQEFYVDDLLTGGETVEEVSKLRENLTSKLSEYGFNLRKWNSNHPAIVKEIRQTNSELKHLVIEDNISKTLGLLWDAHRDKLQYSVKDRPKKPFTKRSVISSIAQIFDPLGLIGPVTILAKRIMQDLWRHQLDWDESLPRELFTRWLDFQNNWEYLKQIEIPRHVIAKEAISLHLHGFCDASETAYGACIYISSINQSGEHTVQLLCAKAKVAPIKVITLPKLELCGAVALSQLVGKVQEVIGIHFETINLWTDSTIVLAWISKPSDHWKTFVSNRVSEIQTKTTNCQWRHISGKDNPADIISRGLSADKLIESELWWKGPNWLKLPRSEWPQQGTYISEEIPEARKSCTVLNCTVKTKIDMLYKYSSFRKLKRVIAYVLRFWFNCKNPNQKRSGLLSPKELEDSLFKIIKLLQAESFEQEISTIKSNKLLSNKSKLISLNPILDSRGILRVGGRIRNSQADYDEKHQMIIPGSHFITELIIKDAHRKQLHAGVQTLLCYLRLRFWIIGGRNAIKRVLRNCTICVKAKPKFMEHQMGDLPKDRVTQAFPFQITGVDYAGPLDIKSSNLRNSKILKAYLCIFVCFVTKAVHIELAVDLTTDSFIKAFKRFMSRRGKPSKIYSDNGTNFLGAKNRLTELKGVAEFAAGEEISWKFIPPRTPHFGGLWEAAVKSAKYHLKRTIGATILTYEELYTILTQIESCLNSRPLSPISSDHKDLNPLTPSHFLIGRHPQSITDENLLDIGTNRLNRHQLVTRIFQDFWSRWSKEYLHNLQQRSKWQLPSQEQPKEGELVLIRDQGLPPFYWKLGRVTKVHPGQDGTVRVVELQTAAGMTTRSIRQICKLPMQ